MTSHELARLLLLQPDKPIALSVYDHVYSTAANLQGHGPLSIGLLRHYAGEHIVIGDIRAEPENADRGNWHVKQILWDGHNQ